jgi:hypothetical protein
MYEKKFAGRGATPSEATAPSAAAAAASRALAARANQNLGAAGGRRNPPSSLPPAAVAQGPVAMAALAPGILRRGPVCSAAPLASIRFVASPLPGSAAGFVVSLISPPNLLLVDQWFMGSNVRLGSLTFRRLVRASVRRVEARDMRLELVAAVLPAREMLEHGG